MRVYRGRFNNNPNEPETGVNLRQHVVHCEVDECARKTGVHEERSVSQAWAEDGYRLYARRPRSEVYEESVAPEKADEIEDFTHGIMPLDRW